MPILVARRMVPVLIAWAALSGLAVPAAGQVAPTLPRDTLFGKKLPPESSVPRGVVAPTLPRDTLGGRRLPPTANVPHGQTPTYPSDTVPADSAARAGTRARADHATRLKADSTAVKPRAATPARSKRRGTRRQP